MADLLKADHSRSKVNKVSDLFATNFPVYHGLKTSFHSGHP